MGVSRLALDPTSLRNRAGVEAEQREGALDNAITLSFVDQSPIRRGCAAADALRETVELARLAEEAGYARYRVAEHHNTPAFAGDGEVEQ